MTDSQHPGPRAAVDQRRPPVERHGAAPARPAAPRQPRAGGWRRLARHPAVELGLVAVLLVLATVSRRLGYLLSHSFWLDEGWVADSVRAPFHQLRMLTSSTPIGWTSLLRLVPEIGPPERLRLLPIAFAVAAVVPAYLLGRRLGRVQAVAAGVAAAIAPSAIANDDLKQYTGDVFVTLLLLWLGARVEADWTGPERRGPWRLLVLCVACAAAVLVSHAAVFASAAVFGALALRCLAERRWGRLRQVLGLGLVAGAVEAAVFLVFLSVGDNAAMQRYWGYAFVPVSEGPGRAVSFVATRLAETLGRAGFGPWALAVVLALGGLAALWRGRLPATALAVPVLLAELVVAGAAHRYPFLDERTSLFVTVLFTVCAGLGVGALVAWSFRRPATVPVGLAAAGLAAALLVPASREAVRRPMPGSTLRQQVAFVLENRRPGDVVLVGRNASFAFAYYWPDRPTFTPTQSDTAVLFQVDYPDRPELVVTHQRGQPGAEAAVREATARTRSGRVWLVLAEAGDGGPVWGKAAPTARRANSGRLPLLLLTGARG
ncbi:MAG TPA: hypothetical protein VNK73_15155 [Actinomycetota bacterium]|nr:hypothetical protein [Actinomycetota bacterium]